MPSWKNIFVNPRASVVPGPRQDSNSLARTEVWVDGLICYSLCVRRAKRALEEASGVQEVTFLPAPDRFDVVSLAGATQTRELGEAVLGVVVMPKLREILEKLGRPLLSVRRKVSKE